jgi:hypothetical protein
MAAAANYAWVNRSSMTFLTRQAFAKQFRSTPDDLDMHVIYDVSHNIAKVKVYCCSDEVNQMRDRDPGILGSYRFILLLNRRTVNDNSCIFFLSYLSVLSTN